MVIREDIVASAANFLRDPSVAASPIENRIAFLQAKNLTPEEVNAALAQAGSGPASTPAYPSAAAPAAAPGAPQQHYGRYPPYGWQPMPPEVPRRDWRDWFIMATVVSGVGYGLFALTKRYIYPLVAPPTPERLAQDKKSIDEQFEKAFALVEQLAKDTEVLKAAEQERTNRLDSALSELETVIDQLKSANRRREDEAQRVRDDVQALKDAVPKALETQKDLTDVRLRELNTELKNVKTLITQRMNPTASSTAGGNYLRTSTGNAAPTNPGASLGGSENAETNGRSTEKDYQDYVSGLNRNSPFSSGTSPAKASIPAWQMAMATKTPAGASSTTNGQEAGSSGQEASSS